MEMQEKCDPMGQAIWDFARTGKSGKLVVRSSMFDDDEMSVANLFRTEMEMPCLERVALDLCRGRVLDVGAGAGCHTIALEKRGFEVTSIDISPFSTQARLFRGAHDARCINLFEESWSERFDTIILLMNGLGIAGKLSGLPRLLNRCSALLEEGGQILADSSDIRYVFEDEDGEFYPPEETDYYGEVDYQMVYNKCVGEPFDWLYVDFDTLQRVAETCGLRAEKVRDGEHFDYLCRITR